MYIEADNTFHRGIEFLRQAITYFFVGAVATLADWGSFYFIKHRWDLANSVALTVALIVGSMVNYLLNKTLTFRARDRHLPTEMSKFALVWGISYLLSQGILFIYAHWLHISPVPARMATTATLLPVNFLLMKYLVFHPQSAEAKV